MPDGRVELVMEGPEGEMAGLVKDVSAKMNGYIKNVRTDTSPATGEFRQFSVKH
jgi:acylphosphatase